ncbi:MAG: hypothetical protein V2B19_30860 [Pseudomonadota bacterium]
MKVYRAVLAVDHYDLLADARSIVGRHRNLILSGEAAIGIELLTLLNTEPADMAIFSIAAPSQGKREVIRVIARRYPRLKIFFIHHRILTPSPRDAFTLSRPDIVSGGIPVRFTAFNATDVPSNVFHRQWEFHLIEH